MNDLIVSAVHATGVEIEEETGAARHPILDVSPLRVINLRVNGACHHKRDDLTRAYS